MFLRLDDLQKSLFLTRYELVEAFGKSSQFDGATVVVTFIEAGLTFIMNADQNTFAVRVGTEGIYPVPLGTEELVGGVTLLEEQGLFYFH